MPSSMHLSQLRKWIFESPPIEFAMSHLKELVINALKQGPIPQHIAFVMDGNRRFARSHGIETVEGHNLGFEALASILEVCYKSGVKVVTIYAFSIENFKRSKFEVDALMDMAKLKLSQMVQHGDLLDRYGARVRVLGRLDMLKPDVLAAVNRAVELTSRNGDRVLNICFPYTSRDEITSAVRDTVIDYSKPLMRSTRSASAAARQRARFSESHIALNIRAQALGAHGQEKDQAAALGVSDQHSDSESVSTSAPEEEDDGSRSDQDRRIYESGSSFSSSSTLHIVGQQQQQQQQQQLKEQQQSPGLLRSKNSNTHIDAGSTPLYISPETITHQTLTDHMFTKGNPPLDILIRTSGVERLSDFMLWQCHEDTEIVFLDVLWPEFGLWHFLPVLLGWQRRISKMRKDPDAEGDFDGNGDDSGCFADAYDEPADVLSVKVKAKDL